MSRHLVHRLAEMIIRLIDRFLSLVLRLRGDQAGFPYLFPDMGPVLRLVGDGLRNNIFCPGDGFLRRMDAFFF